MANEDARAQWAGDMGGVWARRQADLDALMAQVLDLLMDRAGLVPGMAALDVGCGAGATTLAAAQAVGPEGRVTGLDPSAPLLAIGRSRAAGFGNVAFAEGDAETDAAPGGPFDAAISRFGVMFFDDPVAAFANIARQLAHGAGLTFAAWAGAAENPWFAVPARVVAARFGAEPQGDPDAPGPTAFRDPVRVTGLLARAGLREAAGEPVDVTLRHPGGAAALAALGLEVGPAGRRLRLAEGGAADREALRRDLEAAFAPYDGPGGARVPARVILYRARAA